MIEDNAVAIVSKAYYVPQPKVYFDEKRYSMMSSFVPGVEYDVHYTNECNTNDGFHNHEFKVKLTAGIFNNPAGCDEDNTGVLSFTCGSGS
jgi:hypothetical protein